MIASLAAICAGCAAPVKEGCLAKQGQAGEVVHLVAHRWHAGIVFPRRHESIGAWPVAADFAAAEYLEVGWGDRAFYQANEPQWSMALKAILLPSTSVLHVAGFSGAVADQFPASEIVAVDLSSQAFVKLAQHVADSFSLDPQGRAVGTGNGLYGYSRFYLSRDTYHAFNTCNAWSARALRAAGCPISPAGALTVDGLLRQVRALRSQPRRLRRAARNSSGSARSEGSHACDPRVPVFGAVRRMTAPRCRELVP